MLVTTAALLQAAERGGYAVGAFNIHSLEMLPPVLGAAEALSAPVILQFTEGSLRFIGPEALGACVTHMARISPVPVAIHLDHGSRFDLVVQAIRHGFTSVMIDASTLPYEQNVALTRRVVSVAHAAGVSVEAEIGHVPGQEEPGSDAYTGDGLLTPPALAEQFFRDTEVDALAVAFGTAHGFYRGEPRLDLERLAEIHRRVPVPLVMHGGSGVPDAQIRRAVAQGIRKVNVATELKHAWACCLRTTLAAEPEELDPRHLLKPAREAVAAVVEEKIRLLGSAGRG